MKINDPPGSGRTGQRVAQPHRLNRSGQRAVRLLLVSYARENLHRPLAIAVVTLVTGKSKVGQIGREAGDTIWPFVIANTRKKPIRSGPGAKSAGVWIDVLSEELANVRIDVRGFTVRI